ncbi:hypothetical protein DFH08DRAFT_720746, partial [Mycena albidolilacea]
PPPKFKDSDLACILQNATSWRAGMHKARGIPRVLRVIEMLGIEQARRWGACSLNDFRRSLGLEPYRSFREWNPIPEISDAAAKLYKDIENQELYVGLHAEETKPLMGGAGMCSGYTVSRSILADIVSLTRGDRFFTVEFTPFNLTSWGHRDCQPDPHDGTYGGMLARLLFRTLPDHYPPRSVYAHFPFMDPVMRDVMSHVIPNTVGEYIWTRPTMRDDAEDTLVVKTLVGIRAVLDDRKAFPPGYSERLMVVTGYRHVDWVFVRFPSLLPTCYVSQHGAQVNKVLLQDINKWTSYFGLETSVLIQGRSTDCIGKSRGRTVDVVRDVINVLPVRWICMYYVRQRLRVSCSLQSHVQEAFHPRSSYVLLNSDPVKDWRLRESSVQAFRDFSDVVKAHLSPNVGPIRFCRLVEFDRHVQPRIPDPYRASLAESLPFLKSIYSERNDLAVLIPSLFSEVVVTARQWSQVIAHVVNYYLDDHGTHAREEIVRLARLQSQEANERVRSYIHTALGRLLRCI